MYVICPLLRYLKSNALSRLLQIGELLAKTRHGLTVKFRRNVNALWSNHKININGVLLLIGNDVFIKQKHGFSATIIDARTEKPSNAISDLHLTRSSRLWSLCVCRVATPLFANSLRHTRCTVCFGLLDQWNRSHLAHHFSIYNNRRNGAVSEFHKFCCCYTVTVFCSAFLFCVWSEMKTHPLECKRCATGKHWVRPISMFLYIFGEQRKATNDVSKVWRCQYTPNLHRRIVKLDGIRCIHAPCASHCAHEMARASRPPKFSRDLIESDY